MKRLPIETALPDLWDALKSHQMAVLQAPPGAGKTTRVPLFLIENNLIKGKILMLEPRRLAASAAAEHMAEMLGEALGETVGYRMRGDSKSNKDTRIEVITEGILTRMIQSDPELRDAALGSRNIVCRVLSCARAIGHCGVFAFRQLFRCECYRRRAASRLGNGRHLDRPASAVLGRQLIGFLVRCCLSCRRRV